MKHLLNIQAEVAQALANGAPVVALETTVLSHGLPWPENLDTVTRMQKALRDVGALPATVALQNRRIHIGLDDEQLHHFATAQHVTKASRRDLAAVVASGADGATTVSGTMVAAHLAGIEVFATGGIGGVHRDGELSLDISADLMELGRTPVSVVSSGAKSILDLPRTLEVLESYSVPVVGYGTRQFPGFYVRDTGLPVDICVTTPAQAAELVSAHLSLSGSGLLIANPVPAEHALNLADVEIWIEQALASAQRQRVTGKQVTPFLLRELTELSDGWTKESNVALLENNARVAGEIAVAMAQR